MNKHVQPLTWEQYLERAPFVKRHLAAVANIALHHHSFQPYALLDDDDLPYYVGYRCKDCGEAGYVVP